MIGRALAASFVLVSGTLAQSATIVRVPEGMEAPRIDGDLSDAVWQQAGVLGSLTEVLPVEGNAPSERTEIRMMYDERNLYLALRCFDSDPAGIRATQAKRDANLDPDDRVEWLFDPFLDRRNAFWFQIGPGGSRGDALITKNGSRFDKRWDTIWFGEALVTEEGWQAEVRIPTQSINFDPEAAAWGFNLRRLLRRRNEEMRWAAPENRTRFFQIARAGTLTGFEGLRQGIGLDVLPFVVLDGQRRSGGDWDEDVDAGLTAFYRVSPATKLALSFNTDFAEVEVDDRQVNLSRFPLFFPERRDFFLEDSGAFFFGGGTQGGGGSLVEPFFSRRIGLDAEGGEVPLEVAAKLTRRTESSGLGLLAVRTGAAGTLDDQELFVGRFSRNLGEESDVGVIWTHGDPRGLGRDDTYGLDLNLRTTEFLGDRNLRLSAFALRSDPSSGETGDVWYAGLSYPNDVFSWSLAASGVDENFDPALGFVRRTGTRSYTGAVSYQPRLYSSVRQLTFRFEPELILDTDNNLQSLEIEVQPLGIEWESGEALGLEVSHQREVLAEAFEISDGVTIPAGDTTFGRVELFAESAEKRELSGFAFVSTGEFFDGKRDDLGFGGTWNASARGSLAIDYERNDVRLPGGSFRVHVARARAELQFGPELSWSNRVQWDNVSETVGLNSRLWWIPRPGTELFLVLNQGWNWDTSSFRPEDSQVTLKLGTTLRF